MSEEKRNLQEINLAISIIPMSKGTIKAIIRHRSKVNSNGDLEVNREEVLKEWKSSILTQGFLSMLFDTFYEEQLDAITYEKRKEWQENRHTLKQEPLM